MTADDYVAAPASLALAGAVTEPLGDGDLGAVMRHRGLVVHEEAVLPELLPLLQQASGRSGWGIALVTPGGKDCRSPAAHQS